MFMDKIKEVVILCGGRGTRLLPLTKKIPKPLLELGGKPILEHLIQNYKSHNFTNVKLLVGYKGRQIKKYFNEHPIDGISIECIDTGLDTDTAERIWAVRNKVNSSFALCYGDVIGDIDFTKQIKFHRKKSKIMNITTVPLRSSKGIIAFDKNFIASKFTEKPLLEKFWVNAGFFIIESDIFEKWNKDHTDFSKSIIPFLCKTKNVSCYTHKGFWSSMDSDTEFRYLNNLCLTNQAPWIKINNG